MIQVLDATALVSAGLMAGSELAIAAFVNPALTRLQDKVHLSAAIALAGLLGRVMPFWYGLVLVLTASDAVVHWHFSGQTPGLIVASAGLWAIAIVYTISALVPINNRVAAWTESTLPADWKSYRGRWDQLHRWRVLLLVAAFAFLVTGILRSTP